MSSYKGSQDAAKGSPNLEHMQYLQDNWGSTEVSAVLRVAKVSIDSTVTGTSGVAASDIPVGAQIVDAWNICKATVGSGSATVRVGGAGASISDAMNMATNDALTRASSIDSTYSVVGTDGVEVVTNSDNDRGDVFIAYTKSG